MQATAASPALSAAFSETCSTAQLAQLLNVSPRTIDTWRQRGVLKPAGRGRYYLRESMNAYCDALRQRAADGGSTSVVLQQGRVEMEKLKREFKELELRRLSAETISQGEMAAAWRALAAQVRRVMMSLPDKATNAVPTLTEHDRQTLEEVCEAILLDLVDEADQVVGADRNELLGNRL